MCVLTLFVADDMWSQRTVIKWPESGAGSQSVSSALLVSHCQTGSKCRGLSSEAQQTCFLCSRSRVSISLQQVKWRRYKIRSTNLCGHTILLFIPFCVLRVAADALRILLARAQLDEVLKRLDEDKAWDAIKEANTHVAGVTLLARCAQQAGWV